MNLIFLSARLLILGHFCDVCSDICIRLAEKNIVKKRPLNKKLLTFMSNLSHNSLKKWQIVEKRFIHLLIERKFPE